MVKKGVRRQEEILALQNYVLIHKGEFLTLEDLTMEAMSQFGFARRTAMEIAAVVIYRMTPKPVRQQIEAAREKDTLEPEKEKNMSIKEILAEAQKHKEPVTVGEHEVKEE